jgi:hypothetical protein
MSLRPSWASTCCKAALAPAHAPHVDMKKSSTSTGLRNVWTLIIMAESIGLTVNNKNAQLRCYVCTPFFESRTSGRCHARQIIYCPASSNPPPRPSPRCQCSSTPTHSRGAYFFSAGSVCKTLKTSIVGQTQYHPRNKLGYWQHRAL